MTYLQETLLKDEKIVYLGKPHWIVFCPALLIFLLTLILIDYLPGFSSFSTPLIYGLRLKGLIISILLIVAVVMLIQAYLLYRFSEYGITNKRVVVKRGFILRQSVEIFISRIETTDVRQTILGRILNFGSIVVIGTGGTVDYFSNVVNPLHFRAMVQEQLSEAINHQDR